MFAEDTGLSIEDIVRINNIFRRHGNIDKVVIYGSRAMGNYKPASDIDLALMGRNIDLTQIHEIEDQLDELLLPYKFDLTIYSQIQNKEFLDHIFRVGKVFYKQSV